VKLNVAISNPYIIIPKSTSDDEHVLVDLGKITIGNSFVRTSCDASFQLIYETLNTNITGLWNPFA
jgi:hypothetical protein